jgi:aminoglycoside phosphotransferase (APT) family kinase protein
VHDPKEMPARLAAFLAAAEPDWRDIEVTSYEVMTGGYSRLLAKAHVRHSGGEATFVLRGDPPKDKQLIETDRRQEYDIVRTVGSHGVRTPRALYFDETGSTLGTRALVLEFSRSPSFLPYAAAGGSLAGAPERLAEAMASFHSIPLDALPAQLARPGSYEDYITGRIDEWRQTAAEHVEDLPVLRYIAAWLDAHRPEPVPLTLIHGDCQMANMLISPDGHFELLDWELASIGDPREDMGYNKATSTAMPPNLLSDELAESFCARYRALTGLSESQVNPVTVSYFLVLGVVGVVRKLCQGGAAYARGENRLLSSVFNMRSIMYGQGMWIDATKALEPLLRGGA